MQRKSEVEMERARIAKVTRSLIRLKHSLKADEELNNLLPDTLKEFDDSVQAGKLLRLYPNLDSLLED